MRDVTQGGDFLDVGHRRFGVRNGIRIGVGSGRQTCSLGVGSLTGHITTEVISSNLLLSSHAKNSISEMTNGSKYISPVWSPEMFGNREGFGVGGTWLQLMCCAVSRRRVPNFERQELGRGLEIGGRR